MAGRGFRDNEIAAILAAVAGVLFLLVGYSGERAVQAFFEILAEIFNIENPGPGLRLLAFVLFVIASLGGVAVLIGAVLFYLDRVTPGKILILLGAGAGIISLIFFLLVLIRRPGRVLAHEGAIPVLIGVVLSIAARWKARPLNR